jgi:hypothetical protein
MQTSRTTFVQRNTIAADARGGVSLIESYVHSLVDNAERVRFS